MPTTGTAKTVYAKGHISVRKLQDFYKTPLEGQCHDADGSAPCRRADHEPRRHIMKSRMRLFGVALALVCVTVLGSEPDAKAQSEPSPKGLQGTWGVTVTPYNCSNKLPLGFSFRALLAFARGGTLSGASSNAGFQPGQYSASFGVWRQTGQRTYSAVTDAFILFSGGPFTAGTQEIRHTIHVSADGNRFIDEASLNYVDVNDVPIPPQAPLIPGCATAAGQRVE
jgi:hypothetical protein